MNSRESNDRISSDLRSAAVLYELPGWAHYVWLIYLGFLFTPVLGPQPHGWGWLWPTLASVPVFLFLYARVIRAFRDSDPPGRAAFPEVVTIALMAYALMPFNDSANTYLIYCAAVSPFTLGSLRRVVVFVLGLLAGYALELALLGFKPVLFAVITVVAIASSLTNFMMTENRRKNVALRHSREEMHRMARVAERERIGRDLHDLLGHTLSLIALKSELAAKLLDRDRAAAAREIADVTSIARDALKQVRTAVAGIRAAALENEIASARALLSTSGIALLFERDGAVLSAEIETTLAMIVREAVTNIQRHSGAREARIEVLTEAVASGRSGEADGKKVEERVAWLRVNDNGRGGITSCGNGLQGIGERVRSLGGTLEIDSPRGKGTTLRVRLPLRGPLVGPAAGVTPAGKTGAMAVPDAPGQASAAMVRT
jgi:two-component system sensor histidine kinase DesK